MRRGAAVVLGALILLGATACNQSIEDVKRDGEFSKACKENGGEPFYNGLTGALQCDFDVEE
jgi:hypothetical protein